MSAIAEVGSQVPTAPLCFSLGLSRAALYRWRQPKLATEPKLPRARHPRSLDPHERQTILDTLNSKRFCDASPAEVHATLLEEDTYLASTRTMYRVLSEANEVRERRDQLRHPSYAKPELLATQPNQVWSWDITKLKGPIKWSYFYLFVVLDIFSRYVVGWMVAHGEGARLAERLIEETCAKQNISPGQLTIHADRGPAMTSKTVALLFSDLDILRSHSRPYVSDDNPFSESHFRTLKYRPDFPTASARSSTRVRSAARCSLGTTPSITTAVWPSSRLPPCTTAALTRSSMLVTASASPPTPPTPNASSTGRRGARVCRTRFGSTRQRKRRTRMPQGQRKQIRTTLRSFPFAVLTSSAGDHRRASSTRSASWSPLTKCRTRVPHGD
jgi:putative transposase